MVECQYCKKEYNKGLKMHERYCKMNPEKRTSEIRESISVPERQPQDLAVKNESDASHPAAPTLPEPPISLKPNNNKKHWWQFWRQKKGVNIEEVYSPEDLLEGLKPYQILQSDPKKGMGKIFNREKDFIQVVLVSELIEPKTFWAEKTGMNRIQFKDRMFKLPRDVKGNVFFWHIDKKEPLVDAAHADENDAETSFHELQLFNMAYSVGRAAGANDLMNNLKLILLMVGGSVLLLVAVLVYLNQIDKGINADTEAVMGLLTNMSQRMP